MFPPKLTNSGGSPVATWVFLFAFLAEGAAAGEFERAQEKMKTIEAISNEK